MKKLQRYYVQMLPYIFGIGIAGLVMIPSTIDSTATALLAMLPFTCTVILGMLPIIKYLWEEMK